MKLTLFAGAVLIATGTFGQVIERETQENEATNTRTTITAVETGMYQGTDNPTAQKYFDEAVEAGYNKDYEAAEKLYLKAIKADKEFVEAYDNLGRVYRVMGEMDKAIEYYTKSIDIYPKGDMAYQNLAIVYSLQGDYAKAEETYERLLDAQPGNVEGLYGLASCYAMTERYEDALEYAEDALEIYKREESVHLGDGHHLLGIINFHMDDLEEAKENFREAKRLGVRVDQRINRELFGDSQSGKGASSSKGEEPEKTYVLENEEDYALYEEDIIKMVDWLVYTPVEEKPDVRAELIRFTLHWMMGSPSVSIEISGDFLDFTKKCDECLVIYMGGWTKYSLENNYSEDKVECTLAGIEAVIEFYTRNKKELGKNKHIENLIKMKEAGELRKHVEDTI